MNDTQITEIERLEIAAQGAATPGSFEEEAALERIERLRLEERAQLGDSFAARRLRARRHFRSGI